MTHQIFGTAHLGRSGFDALQDAADISSRIAHPENITTEQQLALRYAHDPVEAFNLFIEQWVAPCWHAHLLDDDDNAGQYVRDLIDSQSAALDRLCCRIEELEAENAALRERVDELEWEHRELRPEVRNG